jgi:hypothetical protein
MIDLKSLAVTPQLILASEYGTDEESINRFLDQIEEIAKSSDSAVYVRIETTVELAQAILARFNKRNVRGVSDTHSKKLVRNVDKRLWVNDTSKAITIDSNIVLSDGQHRLTLILLTGQTITFLYGLGVNPAETGVIDTRKPRNLAVYANNKKGVGFATEPQAAVAIRIARGHKAGKGLSAPEQGSLIIPYVTYAKKVLSMIAGGEPTEGLDRASVYAVAARALMRFPKAEKKLSVFINEYLFASVGDKRRIKEAKLLQEWVRNRPSSNSGGDKLIWFGAQEAISAYLDGRIIAKIAVTNVDHFPIPEGFGE